VRLPIKAYGAGLVCVACALPVAVGCSRPHAPRVGDRVSRKNPAALAVVLVDVSKSTAGQRERYRVDFAKVMGGLSGGTLVIADQIDADPLSSTSLPVRIFLEKASLMGKNPAIVKSDNERARARAMQGFAQLLGRRPKGNSILDALDIAQEVFAAYPHAKARYLIILSDMVENSERYRFTPRNLKPAKIRAFMARERNDGNLPDLKGVQMYVAGAGATKGVEGGDRRIRAVENFWLSYVRGTGASLPRPRYGPALVRFP
jgi:hypothetical protein